MEASLARFVRGLFFPLTSDGGFAPDYPIDLAAGLAGRGADRPLFKVLHPLLARGVWSFLLRNGGYRRLDAIVAARKKTGRLWEVWGPEPLTIGAATIEWLSFTHDSLAGSPLPSAESPGARSPLLAGDRLALSIALLPLASDAELAERIPEPVKALAWHLPLLALAAPTFAQLREGTFALNDAHESVALQYLDDFFAASWTQIALPTRRRPVAARATMDSSLASTLGALFAAATPGTLDHHLVPVARFYPALWRASGGAQAIQNAVEQTAQQLSLQGARETFLGGYGNVLRFGIQLEERVRAIQQTPWADRTESQKRLAAEYEAWYRPVAEEVRLLSRRLTREVG